MAHPVLKGVVSMPYESLLMLPLFNGVTVIGDKKLSDYGLVPMTSEDITEIMREVFGYVL